RLLDPLPDVAADVVEAVIAAELDAHHDDLAVHLGGQHGGAARDRRRLGDASCRTRISCILHGVACPTSRYGHSNFSSPRCRGPNTQDDYVVSGTATTSKATLMRGSSASVGRVQWAK